MLMNQYPNYNQNNQCQNNNYPNNPYPNQYPNNNYPINQQMQYQYRNTAVQKKPDNKQAHMIVGIVLAGIVLLIVGAGLFILYVTKGSYGKYSMRNITWVKRMNAAFTDDEFTYVSYQKVGVAGLGAFNNKNEIIVASKKYPDKQITVGWNEKHTKVVTDYNFVRYKEDLEEYYKKEINNYLTPDEIAVTYLIVFEDKTEIKDYTFDEFRESRSGLYKLSVFMKYNNAFPSEKEMTQTIDSIISDLHEKIEMTIYLSHNSVEYNDITEGNERYVLLMDSPTRINTLDHYTIFWKKTKTGKDLRQDTKTNIYTDKGVD